MEKIRTLGAVMEKNMTRMFNFNYFKSPCSGVHVFLGRTFRGVCDIFGRWSGEDRDFSGPPSKNDPSLR